MFISEVLCHKLLQKPFFKSQCGGHDGEHHQCVNLRNPEKSRRIPGIRINHSPQTCQCRSCKSNVGLYGVWGRMETWLCMADSLMVHPKPSEQR